MDELDLPHALRDLAGTPRIDGPAVPVDAVTSRVHRGRAVRATGLGAVSVAAVLGIGAAAWGLTPLGDPLPPADPRPTVTEPTPAPNPTGEPAPEPSPEPTSGPAEEPGTMVAPVGLTASGDLVLLDPTTGEVERTVAAGVVPRNTRTDLELDPGRRWAYLTRFSDGTEPDDRVLRVRLSDGLVEPVALGSSPAVSPDGRTLALVVRHGATGLEVGRPHVDLIDLATGDTTASIPDDQCDGCFMRVLGELGWSRDGTEVYVAEGWADEPVGVVVRALQAVPGSVSPTVGDGRLVGPHHAHDPTAGSWRLLAPTSDGRLVVGGRRVPPSAAGATEPHQDAEVWDDGEILAVVDPATGEVLDERPVPDTTTSAVAVSPDGTEVLSVDVTYADDSADWSWTLRRWTVGTDEVAEVTDGITAIAW